MTRVPLHIPLPGRDPCPYCISSVELQPNSKEVYNGKDYGPIWLCFGCGAYVGCHPGTFKALGRVADKQLRQLKIRAHASFDPIWQWKIKHQKCRKGHARRAGYLWLAGQLGIARDECHIGYFTPSQCQRVIDICQPIKSRLKWSDL